MKLKFLISILSLLLVTGCSPTNSNNSDGNNQEEIHNFSSNWSYDDKYHWHACVDNEYEYLREDEALHVFGEWIDGSPNQKDDQEKVHYHVCKICDYCEVASKEGEDSVIENEPESLVYYIEYKEEDNYNSFDETTGELKEEKGIKLTISSNSKTDVGLANSKNATISYAEGFDQSSFSYEKVTTLSFGDNITGLRNIEMFEESSIANIEFGKDFNHIDDFALSNIGNRSVNLIFHCDLFEHNKETFKRNGSLITVIYIDHNVKGFPRYFEGARVFYIGEDIPPMPEITWDEFCYQNVLNANKNIMYLYNRAVDTDHLYDYLYPYSGNLEDFSIMKEFALDLVKDINPNNVLERTNEVFNYIKNNIEYDNAYLDAQMIDCFNNKKAVCSQYVAIMHDMLAALGIFSVYCNGYKRFTFPINDLQLAINMSTNPWENNDYQATLGEINQLTHAWLAVVINNEVHYYDPTWFTSYGTNYEGVSKQYITINANFIAVKPDSIDEYHLVDKCFLLYKNYNFLLEGKIYRETGVTINGYLNASTILNTNNDYSNNCFGNSCEKGEIYSNCIVFGTNRCDANYCRGDGFVIPLPSYIGYIQYLNKERGYHININIDQLIIDGDYVYLNTSFGKFVVTYLGDEEVIRIPTDTYIRGICEEGFTHLNSVKEIYIPNNTVRICDVIEYNPKLERVYFGSELQDIGLNEFLGCPNIKEYVINNDNQTFTSKDGHLYSKDMETLRRYVNKDTQEYNFPNSVTTIDQKAFSGSNIKNISIPSTVTKIGYFAFEHCYNLESVYFEDRNTLLSSPGYTFSYCVNLTTVRLVAELKSIHHAENEYTIPELMFSECLSLYQIDIPSGIKKLENGCFLNSGIVSVTIPSSLESIEGEPFAYADELKEIVGDPNNVLSGYEHIDSKEESKMEVIDNKFVFYNESNNNHRLAKYIGKEENIILPTTSYKYTLSWRAIIDVQYFTKHIANTKNSFTGGNLYLLENTYPVKSLTFSTSVACIEGNDSVIEHYEDRIYLNLVNLDSLSYNGTIEEWNETEKNPCWCRHILLSSIECSNGSVNIH